jgi:hypothetical protein
MSSLDLDPFLPVHPIHNDRPVLIGWPAAIHFSTHGFTGLNEIRFVNVRSANDVVQLQFVLIVTRPMECAQCVVHGVDRAGDRRRRKLYKSAQSNMIHC